MPLQFIEGASKESICAMCGYRSESAKSFMLLDVLMLLILRHPLPILKNVDIFPYPVVKEDTFTGKSSLDSIVFPRILKGSFGAPSVTRRLSMF